MGWWLDLGGKGRVVAEAPSLLLEVPGITGSGLRVSSVSADPLKHFCFLCRELTPLEEASLQNQKLKATYEARLARLNPSQTMQKTSLASGACGCSGRPVGLSTTPHPTIQSGAPSGTLNPSWSCPGQSGAKLTHIWALN